MQKKIEQFADYYNRLFPQPYNGDFHEKRLSRSATFQVTDACNLRCTYCYQINKGHHAMPFSVAKKFVDYLLDADETNTYINPVISPAIILDFIGGEPLLEIGLIDRIVDYFLDQAIKKHHPWATAYMISICSNGVLYFDPAFQAFIKKHRSHLSFSISIDGNKKLHDACRVFPDGSGSYDIAIRGVRHFRDEWHGSMGSKMTLAPGNIAYTYEALRNLVELGYTQIFANCVYEKGWEYPHAAALYWQMKQLADYLIDSGRYKDIYISLFERDIGRPKPENDLDNWCGGTGYMLAVDYKGDIYPCLRYMESSLGTTVKPMIIGNVDTGIMATPEQCRCVHCLKCIDRRTQSTDECFYCPIAQGCSWCSAYNYQCFGTADKRATYICIMHQARVLANVYYWNRIFRLNHRPDVFANHVPDDWALKIIGEDELAMLKKLEERK